MVKHLLVGEQHSQYVAVEALCRGFTLDIFRGLWHSYLQKKGIQLIPLNYHGLSYIPYLKMINKLTLIDKELDDIDDDILSTWKFLELERQIFKWIF